MVDDLLSLRRFRRMDFRLAESVLGPKLSYAGIAPKMQEMIWGGRVKLAYLSNYFPEQQHTFNILYLVSSALPIYVPQWIQRCKDKGIKIVLNQNGVFYKGWFGDGWEKENELLKTVLHSADYIFYQSKFCKLSCDKFLGVPRVPYTILYNAIDTRLFCPAYTDSKKVGPVILLAGNQNEFYRLEKALYITASLKKHFPTVKILIAGRLGWQSEGRWKDAMLQLAHSLSIRDNLEYIGPYTQETAPALYHRADVLLHTQYNACCPTVVLEAMACGLPVVYSDSGGVKELVGEEAGIGVHAEINWEDTPALNIDDFVSALQQVIAALSHFSYAARERAVQYFDIAHWQSRHMAVFKGLISSYEKS